MFKLFHFGTLLLQLVVGVSSRKLAECFENLTWNSCESIRSCMWVRGGCLTRNVWLGYAELGQTHVIRARGETRLAPKIIAEREAELLFFPTTESDPTPAPTGAPSSPIEQEYGLEKIGYLTAELPSSSLRWPNGYPKDVSKLIDGTDSEYYFPGSVLDVDIKFDLLQNRAINGVYIKIWYYTNIDSIEIGLQSEEGVTTWIDGGSHTDGLNEEVSITFRAKAARYIRIRLTGGSLFDDKSSEWGLRTVKISGNLDAKIVEDPVDNEDDKDSPLSSFFPPETADVIVEAFTASGIILGEIKARPTSQQRGIMDQAGTDEPLEPYSKAKEMWSATLPWHWVKEGTQLVISVANRDGIVISYDLQLVNTVLWSEHTLIRRKFILFGTDQQFKRLNTFTYDASRLATGMFGIMPIATLNWVDATVVHWPYLIISTSKGPRIVYNEKERRAEMLKAGDDPSTEPGWEFTKYMVAFRTSYANTGRGFVITTMEAPGEHGSPYSTQTAIAMGWALVNDNSNCTFCEYKSLGYWGGWSAAAWSGWCGMRAGDECGNTLSHEIGHSMTLSHFTEGTALDWGIADEYPEDGTHLASHPWGYDTPSRQFRTWYNAHDGSSKRGEFRLLISIFIIICLTHFVHFWRRSYEWRWRLCRRILLRALHRISWSTKSTMGI
jgi:Peptidase M66